MIDLKYIRENPDIIELALQKKKTIIDIDCLLKLDSQKRELQFDFDKKRALQNKISKEIPILKKKGEDVATVLSEMQQVASDLKNIAAKLSEINKDIDRILATIPNIPHSSVPQGNSEADNLVVKNNVTEADLKKDALEHQIIAEKQNLLDLPRGAKITGSGFPIYKGIGALLERALINFMLDFHREKHGYEELIVPYIVNRQSMYGTGQLPKLEDDMYTIEKDDLFLIPTGEVPVTNIYADEVLSYSQLPIKFVTHTPCFRREAGSYGKDNKGLQRIHQFNKVELVRFVTPDESYSALEEMVAEAEAILEALGLPYRRVLLNTSDLSFASAKTYDLEVWSPGVKKFLEVSSLSNFEDFQARRANIRYRDESGKVRFLHTLNGSGLATPRTFIAIIENFQQSDESFKIPEVLSKYLNL